MTVMAVEVFGFNTQKRYGEGPPLLFVSDEVESLFSQLMLFFLKGITLKVDFIVTENKGGQGVGATLVQAVLMLVVWAKCCEVFHVYHLATTYACGQGKPGIDKDWEFLAILIGKHLKKCYMH